MSASAVKYSYTHQADSQFDLPILPVILEHGGRRTQGNALLDTGAPFSVLPRTMGEGPGLQWHTSRPFVPIGGGLNNVATRIAFLNVTAGAFGPINIFFAWTENDQARLILGHFFQNFRICFSTVNSSFDLRPEKKKRA